MSRGTLVRPEVFIIGYTQIDRKGLEDYLKQSGNEDFLNSLGAAVNQGLSDGEILCSFYAKLCYSSLTLGKNANITRIRDITDNIRGAHDQGHGSVLEHASINFVVRNCSRVLTHELVRHRTGTAFSQTSGRYVRSDRLDVVSDPILGEYEILTVEEEQEIHNFIEAKMLIMSQRIDDKKADMTTKKKLTSAARRWLPNGQANEIGFTANMRTLRHTVQIRTSRFAEREIREVFQQVYHLTKEKFPLLYHGAKEEMVDGLVEVSGMKMQPYDKV